MGLFSSTFGGKSTTTTQTSSVPTAGKQEQAGLDFLLNLSRMAGGQIGDLTDIASGNIKGLSPEMAQLVQSIADQQVARESAAVNRNFEDTSRQLREQAAERGQSGDSMEAIMQAIGGREKMAQLGDITSRGSQFVSEQNLALPLQLAQMQGNVNQMLYSMATGTASPALSNILQGRLANRTLTTSEQTSGGIGGLFDLGSKLAGLGMGNPLGALQGLFGSGSNTGARAPMLGEMQGPTVEGPPIASNGTPFYGPSFQ
jgi:hypothetical protein